MKWLGTLVKKAALRRFNAGYEWAAGELLRGVALKRIEESAGFGRDAFTNGARAAMQAFFPLAAARDYLANYQPVPEKEKHSVETFIQPKITGYRQLSAEEALLMNDIKAKGAELEEIIARVSSHIRAQREAAAMLLKQSHEASTAAEAAKFKTASDVHASRLDRAQPERWAAIARTDFQTGLMALVRAVAQPNSF